MRIEARWRQKAPHLGEKPNRVESGEKSLHGPQILYGKRYRRM